MSAFSFKPGCHIFHYMTKCSYAHVLKGRHEQDESKPHVCEARSNTYHFQPACVWLGSTHRADHKPSTQCSITARQRKMKHSTNLHVSNKQEVLFHDAYAYCNVHAEFYIYVYRTGMFCFFSFIQDVVIFGEVDVM